MTPELDTLTVAQLREIADERGVDLPDRARKADIISALEAGDSGEPPTDEPDDDAPAPPADGTEPSGDNNFDAVLGFTTETASGTPADTDTTDNDETDTPLDEFLAAWEATTDPVERAAIAHETFGRNWQDTLTELGLLPEQETDEPELDDTDDTFAEVLEALIEVVNSAIEELDARHYDDTNRTVALNLCRAKLRGVAAQLPILR